MRQPPRSATEGGPIRVKPGIKLRKAESQTNAGESLKPLLWLFLIQDDRHHVVFITIFRKHGGIGLPSISHFCSSIVSTYG